MKQPHERLQHIRRQRGFADASDAAEAFGFNKSTYIQHENGTREISKAAAPRYAKAFRVTAGWLLFNDPLPHGSKSGPKVRFAGLIGAGQEVRPVSDGIESVDAFFEEAVEAFEVRGDSMIPLARDGDFVFASAPRPIKSVLGRECIVDLDDGRRFLKTVERGSGEGLYALMSYNAEPIRDIKIAAAGLFVGVKRT